MKDLTTPRLLILFCLMFSFFLSSNSYCSELTLAVANSTCSTMKTIGKAFTEKTNIKVNYLCQPTGLLVLGIKEGAIDVDYFLSANKRWMDEVVDAGLVNPVSVKQNWGNQLVVVSLPLKDEGLKLQTLADLTRPDVTQILIGDPKVAPYGKYACEAMENAGIWKKIKPKLKYNRKINLTVQKMTRYSFSQRGIVALLYQTSAKDKLLTRFVVPQHLYTQISYFSAPLVKNLHKSELELFLRFMESKEADDVFRSAGFIVYD